MKCKYCPKEINNKGSLAAHEKYCKLNPNRQDRPKTCGKQKGSIPWNKGLTADSDIRVKHKDETKRKISEWNQQNKHMHTEEFKQQQRQRAIERGLGGITQSRWIDYKGKRLGSSYELKVAQELDKHNIQWNTCPKFSYIDPKGKQRTYTPDLYLPEYDVYLDPKNDFLIENVNPALGFTDIEKINLVSEQNDIKIIVLSKRQLTWNEISALLT